MPGASMRAAALAVLLSLAVLPLGGGAAQGGPENPVPPVDVAPFGVPPARETFREPAFGTAIVRVSDTSASGAFATHVYSQLQAFSYDNGHILLTSAEGYVVRRLDDLRAVAGLDGSGWNNPRWHPREPSSIVHFDSNADTVLRIQSTDVTTGRTTTRFTFPADYHYIQTNPSFDELSRDGRWLAGIATRSDGASMLFALNLEEARLGAEVPIAGLYAEGAPCTPDPEWGALEPDWVGVSPLGRHLVVQWKRDGTARCSGLETLDLETGAFVGRVYDGHQHGDLGVDVDGETEFFMTFELSSPMDNSRPALGKRNLPGTATVQEPTYLLALDWMSRGAGHISCQGPHGVCLVTNGGAPDTPQTPLEDELFLVHTDGKVQRLAHHRSSGCGYWVQPRATISNDGRYVAFATDWAIEGAPTSCARWNTDMGVGDPYIIDLGADPGAILPLPPPLRAGTGGPPVLDGDAQGGRIVDEERPTPSPSMLALVAGLALAAAVRRAATRSRR